jgi:hypothetical protein
METERDNGKTIARKASKFLFGSMPPTSRVILMVTVLLLMSFNLFNIIYVSVRAQEAKLHPGTTTSVVRKNEFPTFWLVLQIFSKSWTGYVSDVHCYWTNPSGRHQAVKKETFVKEGWSGWIDRTITYELSEPLRQDSPYTAFVCIGNGSFQMNVVDPVQYWLLDQLQAGKEGESASIGVEVFNDTKTTYAMYVVLSAATYQFLNGTQFAKFSHSSNTFPVNFWGGVPIGGVQIEFSTRRTDFHLQATKEVDTFTWLDALSSIFAFFSLSLTVFNTLFPKRTVPAVQEIRSSIFDFLTSATGSETVAPEIVHSELTIQQDAQNAHGNSDK